MSSRLNLGFRPVVARVHLVSTHLAACLLMFCLAGIAHSQDDSGDELSPEVLLQMQRYQSIEWTQGPATGTIGTMAEIDIPEGVSFTDSSGAQELLQLYGNPRDPSILAAMEPDAEDEDWTLVFYFDEIGYVDDSDRDSLDPDGLIESFRAGIPSSNAARRQAGYEEVTGMSWQEPPFYDPQTNNLTWALNVGFATGNSINYDIRLLGRRGVMKVTLIGSPETYSEAVPRVKELLQGFRFTSGNKYAQWRQGDKIAAVGLAGLVAGGATVAAAKTGLLAKLGVLIAKGGKAIILGIVVFFGAIGSFFKKLFGGGSDAEYR